MSRGRIEINIFYFRGQYPILYRRAHSLIVSCVERTSVDTRRGYACIERLIRERERGEAGGEGGDEEEEEREERKRKKKKQRKMKQYKA